MVSKVAKALSEALSRGYQTDPDALSILEMVCSDIDLIELVKRIIDDKQRIKDVDMTITKKDLEAIIPKEFGYIKRDQITGIAKEDETKAVDFQAEIEIISDPTDKVTAVEGPESFKMLFQSRFDKLMKVEEQN